MKALHCEPTPAVYEALLLTRHCPEMLKSLDVVYFTRVFHMTAVELIWKINDGVVWENIGPLKLMDCDYTNMYSSHNSTSKYVYFHFRFRENWQKLAIFVKNQFFQDSPNKEKNNGIFVIFGHVNPPSDLVIFLLQSSVLDITDKIWRRRWLVKHRKSYAKHITNIILGCLTFNWPTLYLHFHGFSIVSFEWGPSPTSRVYNSPFL